MKALYQNLFPKSDVDPIRKLLMSNPIFKDLGILELSLVQKIVHERNFKANETVYSQGERGVGMYMILSGEIEIFENGKSTGVKLGTGSFFGELSLSDNEGLTRRPTTVIATLDSRLLGFYKPDLEEIITRSPAAGVKILQGLNQVLQKRLQKVLEATNDSRN
jgi:CRP/FNR family cyclic AMP-dependent transcriptional regulator